MESEEQKTILIVDDDQALAEVYRARLEIEGYNVVIKYDGEEALQYLATNEPDIIILDCLLPKFGGLGVLEAYRNDKPKSRIPVIVVSGLDRPEYKQKAFELGAATYLVKSSVSISEMVDEVSLALSKKGKKVSIT
ncbi:MAG: response regulator [Candidatus Nomurabacteria bacterium]|nr:MAG: response regulator [Candidatus Nomurabacteria bacterium]HRV75780.1 response regulator [Candidatus Saccharimonadales bacterium]